MFKPDEIISHPDYRDAVSADTFLDKVREICVYTQNYTGEEVVSLDLAETILLQMKALWG